jgi:dTDP-4-dehydrorhamnose 3,5-epimerase
MDVRCLEISGPLLITPPKFRDERGFVAETYSALHFGPLVGPVEFVQDNHSLSVPVGTIRGLHFQIPPCAQGKLIRVLRGRMYDVVVDIRKGSPTYGRHVGVELSADNGTQLWVPPGFAHGVCTLEANTEMLYKVTSLYSRDHERGIAWNDPALGIRWPIGGIEPVLSRKDRELPPLACLPHYFEFAEKGTARPAGGGESGDVSRSASRRSAV